MGMNLIQKTTQTPVLRKRMMESMRNGFKQALRWMSTSVLIAITTKTAFSTSVSYVMIKRVAKAVKERMRKTSIKLGHSCIKTAFANMTNRTL